MNNCVNFDHYTRNRKIFSPVLPRDKADGHLIYGPGLITLETNKITWDCDAVPASNVFDTGPICNRRFKISNQLDIYALAL